MQAHTDPVRTVERAIANRDLVVVSNRQPYTHTRQDGDVTVDRPAGGLTAALDPILADLGGTWVAWGDGDADRKAVDAGDCVRVPPETGDYTLRRVWLSDDEVDDYYYGYSNRVLWPLCHHHAGKITLESGYWGTYQAVNERFADAVLDQAAGDDVVWFQDYHLALAPRHVRRRRPEATLAHFWHIPWPGPEVYRACPHGRELLDGLLANDLVGFHTDSYVRNFLDCVERLTDATVDHESGRVVYQGETTHVAAFPIGIDADHWDEAARSDAADDFWTEFAATHDLADRQVAVGVERLDYTKGIPQRLDGLARFWETRPEWRGELTYVQKGIESRSGVPAYQRLQDTVDRRIDEINERFGTDDWTPIVSLEEHVPDESLAALYREADVGLVTPLRDGMNLVAKEYVACQVDEPGALVCSELAGVHEQLGEHAVSVHPYDPDDVADAVESALTMPKLVRRRRMAALRESVANEDVFDWIAGQFWTLASIDAEHDPTAELTAL